MNIILSAILLGISLSMDCLAVSITCGLQKSMTIKRGLILALSFAFFQALFPFLGGLIGEVARKYVDSIAPWIAFGLLGIIGVKMFIEGLHYNIKQRVFDFTKPKILLMLSVATSIDAFVVGVGFGLEYTLMQQLVIIAVIGLCTFLFSMAGVIMGMRAYFFKPKVALILGGAILFGLGLRIFLSHILATAA